MCRACFQRTRLRRFEKQPGRGRTCSRGCSRRATWPRTRCGACSTAASAWLQCYPARTCNRRALCSNAKASASTRSARSRRAPASPRRSSSSERAREKLFGVVDRRPRGEALEDLAPLAPVDQARYPAVLLAHLPFVLVEALLRRAEDPQVDVDQHFFVKAPGDRLM